jgi:hypothetical protein
VEVSGGPHIGHETGVARAPPPIAAGIHGDIGLLDTSTPPGQKPLCAPLISGLPRESSSSLARSVRKILKVVATVCLTRSRHLST